MPATRARRLAVALGLTLGLAFGGTASALPLADTVVSFSPGDSLFRPGFPGWGVECGNLFGSPYLGDCGPGGVGAGIFDPLAVTALDGASLALGGASGTPGSIVVAFSSFVVTDGLGPDLRVYDGFGLAEGFILDASADGTAFVRVGTFPGTFVSCFPSSCATDVDLAGSGLASARYFRITADQATSVVGYPEAYDLDAVEALDHPRVPEPTSLVLLGAGLVAAGTVRRRSARNR